jgi:hypothetical protein
LVLVLVQLRSECYDTDITEHLFLYLISPYFYVQKKINPKLQFSIEFAAFVHVSSEGWSQNVEQGHSGIDQGPEHLLAAALHARDAPFQVVQALERYLPLLFVRVHGDDGGVRLALRGRRGAEIVRVPLLG